MAGPDSKQAPIVVVAHPPERGRARSSAPAQAGASCCCCCCCLHSVGALIGAAVAPATGRRRWAPPTPEEEDYADFPGQSGPGPGRSAVTVFWLTTLVLGSLVFVGGGVYAVTNNGDFANGLLGAAFVILMLLPVLLLVAALVAALVLVIPNRPDKMYQLGRLGRITLGMVIGAIVGTLPMAAILVAMGFR